MPFTTPPPGDSFANEGLHHANLKVTPDVPAGLTVQVSSGFFWNDNQTLVEFTGTSSATLNLPLTNTNLTVIALDLLGNIVRIEGSEAAAPDLPAIPADRIPLAAVLLSPSDTQINADMIFDLRPIYQIGANLENTLTVSQISGLTSQLDLKADGVDFARFDASGTDVAVWELNKNHTGIPGENVSLRVNRGSETKVELRWNESLEQWQFTNDGAIFLPLDSTSASGISVDLSAIQASISANASAIVILEASALAHHQSISVLNVSVLALQASITGLQASVTANASAITVLQARGFVSNVANAGATGEGLAITKDSGQARIKNLIAGDNIGFSVQASTLTISAVSGGASFPLAAPDGSAGGPSYSFSSDPSAGMWRDGAGALNLRGASGVNGGDVIIRGGTNTDAENNEGAVLLKAGTDPTGIIHGIINLDAGATGSGSGAITGSAQTMAWTARTMLLNTGTDSFGGVGVIRASAAAAISLQGGSSAISVSATNNLILNAGSNIDLTATNNITLVGSTVTTSGLTVTEIFGPLYDIAGTTFTQPTASAVIMRFVTPRTYTIPSGFTNSRALSGIAASGAAVYNIKRFNSSAVSTDVIGTITWAAASTNGIYADSGEIGDHPFVVGDVLSITAPGTADDTHDELSWTVIGTLT